MNRKFILLAAALVLVLTSLACGINLTMPEDAIDIGPLVTEEILVPLPEAGDTTEVKLIFGAGTLNINPGGTIGLIFGQATYNVEDLKPQVTTSSTKATVEQETFEFELGGFPNFGDMENTWDLLFSDHPITLEIRSGALKGTFELGGLAIEELKIVTGASSITAGFSSPNLTPMSQFRLTTGASKVTLTGLANANFSLMNFDAGLGTYTLDFSGTLLRDATVEVKAVASTIKIIVPAGIPAIVKVNGTLTNVTTHGAWEGTEDSYTQAGAGPTLTINIDLGAGSLTLEN